MSQIYVGKRLLLRAIWYVFCSRWYSSIWLPCKSMINLLWTISKTFWKCISPLPFKWQRLVWVTNTFRWRHNGLDGVSNHQPRDCLLNRLFRRRSKKTPKLRGTGFCAGNSPGTGEFPAQMASNAENVSIWWRHYDKWIRSWVRWVAMAINNRGYCQAIIFMYMN